MLNIPAMISDAIFITFPLLLYFLTMAHDRVVDKEDNVLLLGGALYTSLYLILTYGSSEILPRPIYLINIPLLIAYMKKEYSTVCLMSVTLVYILHSEFSFNLYLLIIEYLLTFIIHIKVKKNFVYLFSLIKVIFISLYVDSVLSNILFLITYACTTFFVLTLINYVEREMKFYSSIKDMENNKQIQKSLFKISNEIKNPLGVIKGYLSLMDGSKKKYNEYMPLVNEALSHSIAILEDFSSLGKLKINKEILDINYLLDEVVDYYKCILEMEGIELVYEKNEDEIFIEGDYKRLKEVLINIIKNAKEALVGVRNPKIVIKTEIYKEKVIVCISDNGQGMDKEELKSLSTPFYTTKKNGTGLGVYLSQEIIKAHKGEMNYVSNKNQGTDVYIKLDQYDLV